MFGEGPARAAVVFVGEQPGDQEDLAGRPFVGPAGQVFDRALAEAGIDRARVYVTNAVKHFKFEPRGKRRIHKKPEHERDRRVPLVARPRARPDQAAAHRGAGCDRGARPARPRSRPFSARGGCAGERDGGPPVLVTVHPSFLRRAGRGREGGGVQFVADLKLIARHLPEIKKAA